MLEPVLGSVLQSCSQVLPVLGTVGAGDGQPETRSCLSGNRSHTCSYLFIPGECVSWQRDPGKALLALTINRGTLWKSSLSLPSQASGKGLQPETPFPGLRQGTSLPFDSVSQRILHLPDALADHVSDWGTLLMQQGFIEVSLPHGPRINPL